MANAKDKTDKTDETTDKKITRNRKTWEELTEILTQDVPKKADERQEFIMDIVRLDDVLKIRQKSASEVFNRIDGARKACGKKMEEALKTK